MYIRSVRHPDDLVDLQRLFEQCRIADGHTPIGEHKYLDLVAGTREGSGAWVVEVDDELIAFFHISPRRDADGWVLETAIHPGHRHSDTIKTVLQTATEVASGAGGGAIRVWVYHPAIAEAVRSLGFRPERQLWQMRIALPPRPRPIGPAGLRLTPFRVESDEEHWIAVNNGAFAGHPENGAWTVETLADRIKQPWFDPEGLLMAWEGEDLVGFCWTKLHPDDLGEIYVIAVDPQYQGRSIGKWLTLEGLWFLHRRTASVAMLYVDAANRSAVGLYERLGFELDHIDSSFIRTR
jgi:mycothiol synthase